jgi:hypothetical protein
MKVINTAVALRRIIAACALFALTVACEVPRPGNAAASTPPSGKMSVSTEYRVIPTHDLSQDEAAGGHTLRKHVGRTDDQLRERLHHEHEISAASTWTDRNTAERAVGTALAQNEDKIQRWLARDSHSNLVLDYDGDRPIGRSLRRDADQPEPCSHATIVLKWSGPGSYYVLTSYPECRS